MTRITTLLSKHLLIFLSLLFLISLLLRIVNLTDLPVGFHYDEVNAGYNAYSLLKTGESIQNGPWPLYLNSFGDYRPMGIVYLIIPSIAALGLNEFAVRLPIALIGAVSPLLLFFLVRKYTGEILLAWLSAAFLALSPWHVTLSRATSEGVLAVFFAMVIMYSFKLLLEKASVTRAVLLYILMAFSYLTYHPINLFLIFYIPFLGFFYRKDILKDKFKAVLFLTVFVSYLVFPFLTGIFFGNATSRLTQVVGIFTSSEQDHLAKQLVEEGVSGNTIVSRAFHNKVINASLDVSQRYLTYLSPNYLFFDGGLPKRYLTIDTGLMLFPEVLGFLVLVLTAIVVKKKTILYLFGVWLLVGIIPAAITADDHPNVSRSVLMLPAIQILAAYGLLQWGLVMRGKWAKVVLVGVLALSVWHLTYSYHQYAVHARYYQWLDRSYPAKEIALQLNKIDSSKKVIVTTNFLDPELFVFFYNKIDPKIAQETFAGHKHKDLKTLYNYTFVDEPCPLQQYPKGYDIAIEHAWCVEPKEFKQTPILGSDFLPAFIIVESRDLSEQTKQP